MLPYCIEHLLIFTFKPNVIFYANAWQVVYFLCVAMVSRKEDKVDFTKLEKDIANAVEADERYWRENDAKFRAVHQKVATYDEFRCETCLS